MSMCVALYAAVAALGGLGDRPRLIVMGGDPAPGLLVNLTRGTRPFDPPDLARPTVVFIHGLNLAPGIVHFEMGQRLAEAIARRREPGPGFNVLAWDWNAATFAGLRSRANEEVAVQQGGALAAALRRAGIAPGRTHLIGHSSGCIVAVSAARGLAAGPGQAVARLTLLDPAAIHHPLVFDQLAAGSSALRVENFWTPGPSGYGREAARAGVRDVRIDGPSPYLGLVRPSRSNHLHLVQWYLQTAGDVTIPAGFNASIPRLEMAPR